jgi:hypothetical protein
VGRFKGQDPDVSVLLLTAMGGLMTFLITIERQAGYFWPRLAIVCLRACPENVI